MKNQKYEIIESSLKTDKTRDYLWNRINTPNKIIKVEGFEKDAKVTKISKNNYEIKDSKYRAIVTFIPKESVNLIFVGYQFPVAWFDIKGENNCTISHGEYKNINPRWKKANLKKEIDWLKEHFLEELQEIAK